MAGLMNNSMQSLGQLSNQMAGNSDRSMLQRKQELEARELRRKQELDGAFNRERQAREQKKRQDYLKPGVGDGFLSNAEKAKKLAMGGSIFRAGGGNPNDRFKYMDSWEIKLEKKKEQDIFKRYSPFWQE